LKSCANVGHQRTHGVVRDKKMARFADKLPKRGKATRGRTAVRATALTVRGGPRDPDMESRARARLGLALESMAPRIERVTVRFEDVNGPRGGLDTLCRIKAVVSGEPSVVVEERGHNPDHAMSRAAPRIERSLRQLFDRRTPKRPPGSRGEKRAVPVRSSRVSPRRAKGGTLKKRRT
jgi:hypothetical protein